METLWTDFVNSNWHDWRGSGRSEDRLLLPSWQDAFLKTWKLEAPVPAMEADMEQLQKFRGRLHGLAVELAAGGNTALANRAWLNEVMAQGLVRRRLEGDGTVMRITLSPAESGWRQVMAEVATDFVGTLLEGEAGRIRICENVDCKWVFYDDTRNRTKRYCDDKMCGNLMKVRRFRAKKKAEEQKGN